MPGIDEGTLRLGLHLDGVVQGVGFRPSVYRMALAHGLSGFVRNGPGGLDVEVQGLPEAISRFVEEVRSNPPPSARPDGFRVAHLPPRDERGFEIVDSERDGPATTSIPLETATCPECLSEIRDTDNRRSGHALASCTSCGPRYTITRELPYDRRSTSMDRFAMCPACLAEYADPASRRFHAQANCCPRCGPRLRLVGAPGDDPIGLAARALDAGRIVAIKGLGGFHLACDALDEEAVARLRERKDRRSKPLAVMVADLESASGIARVDERAARLLSGPASPIVLVRKLDPDPLAPSVAPGAAHHGIELAYTPLHHLLMDSPSTGALVMTSANTEGDPIILDEGDGLDRLADLVLTHDRPIVHRTDDSLVRPARGRTVVLRGSRGLMPRRFALPFASPPLVAVGADLKCAVAVAEGPRVVLGPHVGDLGTPASYESFRQSVRSLARLASIDPTHVACDLHPDMLSTVFARDESGLEPVRVQHHAAHAAACLVEASIWEPCISVVFDGMGHGEDSTIWGGEFLAGDPARPRRAAHLDTVPQPGGDAAARQPWRMALSHLRHAFGDAPPVDAFAESLGREDGRGVLGLLRSGNPGTPTSSMGRLFDAVASLAAGCLENGHEAQSAMKLESIVDAAESGSYPVGLLGDDPIRIDVASLVRRIVDDLGSGASPGTVAARFHAWVRDAIVAVCLRLREESGIDLVALSGGTFANALLVEGASAGLEELGFRVIVHDAVPPGDGGIALGQAAVAAARLGSR